MLMPVGAKCTQVISFLNLVGPHGEKQMNEKGAPLVILRKTMVRHPPLMEILMLEGFSMVQTPIVGRPAMLRFKSMAKGSCPAF